MPITAWQRAYDRKRRDKFKKAGICADCKTRKARPSKTRCRICAKRASEMASAWQRKNYKPLWFAALQAYGGPKCSCCGEDNPLFLTLDHINNDAPEERRRYRKSGRSSLTYGQLRKLGYPSGRRVLCFNCNCGRQRNGGGCPHKTATLKAPTHPH